MTPTVTSGAADRSAIEARRVALAGGIGTTIEWYDFFIYGTAAAVVFAPQFFPQVSDLAGTLAAFATFAIGFIARPLGGVAMGHYGDRLGRKSMLVWSLMLMGLSTLGIGLLPNYAQLGVWAPVLLVAFRFVQGFALGGEWGGAVLMSVEHAPQARRGFFGSFVALGLPAGIILSNLVFLITSSAVSPAAFAEWAWRIPFLASAVLVAVGLWVRMGLAESPIFAQVLETQSARRMPILDVLRHDARAVLARGRQLHRDQHAWIHRDRVLRVVRDARAQVPADDDAGAAPHCGGDVRRIDPGIRDLVRPLRTPPDHAVGKWRPGALVAGVLSAG